MSGTSTTPTFAFTKQVQGTRLVSVEVDDTLQLIAFRELGDANQWTLLAQLNNLSPPYIVNDLSEFVTGVVIAGQKISVPAPANQAPSGVADADDVLGIDLALPNGLLESDGAGDILTVGGNDNLVQAIQHRLSTPQGELIRHPRYGDRLFSLLGQGNDPQTLQLAEAWAESCISSDNRVSSVDDLMVSITGDTIMVTAQANPISGRPVPVGGTAK